MAVPLQLLALLLCLWSLTLVCSFNLEPRIPIVKKGSPKSHFGYTVAQHQTILDTVSGGKYKKSWLLVGAPKDQNLQPGTNRSGALWKCPLTTITTDCQQVKTDGFKDPETGLYNFDYVDESLAEPAEDEIKDDQWLGVTLKSQGPGGKVLVCAHRYMHKGRGFQWGFGLCYILSQTLDLDDYLEPCRGKPVNEGHQQYGFCQAGTSGLLLEDEAVLGVPGPYTWRGTVHTSNISDDFLLKDKTQYFGPVTENDSPVDKYSYLGYSVTAGRFFGNYMSYVGGAPRANETGQVVFFSREKIGESQLRVDLILQGEMFASSYGFEVLAVDINNDRRDDLIVGAPFYYTTSSSGAVYVYMNNDGGFTDNHPYTKIEGAEGESRFGFSMTSLGDLNHDGYKDIAIGAPYEGRGAIYIYLGTRNGLMKEPSQVIRAEDMPGIPYDAFGYSLSGGMDLDNNGYPDLLTSSFCSDRVLLIRARPIIDIQTEVRSQNLENIDPTRKGCTEDIGSPETCFSFDACFKMDNEAGTRTGLRLKYIIEEISDRPIVRVRFGDGQKNQPSIVQRDINLRPEDMGSFQCSREIVYLLDGPRNILQPLKFKLSYEIIQREPRPVNEGDPVPDINDYPILNQQEALRYFEGTFAKDCGDDDVCVSDLDVKGRLELQKHATRPHYLLRLGEQDTVSLHAEVTNSGEAAYQSSLLVTHHQALAFDLRESQTGPHQCSAISPTHVQCAIGNPLITTTGPMILSFKESGFPFDSKYIQFTVAANSSSIEETPQDPLNFQVEVIKKAEISIIGSVAPEQAFYGGEVVGESAIKHMDQVGMEITHKYVVDNRGPWRVDEMQVEVLWPHQVENNKEQGKWLLYMTEVPTVDGIGECEIDPRFINPLVLRRQPFPETGPFTGLEVEGELETTDLPGPDGKPPSESEAPTDIHAGSGTGSVKITKTVSTTKKVTSSTSVKKQTSKTTSSKEHSAATERTSYGYSSGYSESGSGYEDTEGSGFGHETGRQHGRAHTRVSRRVYSTSHQSKFSEGGLGVNELGSNLEESDGDVVSHHEESRSSTRTSPDGSTSLTEHHHESRKVIVKEDKVDEAPRGRWSESGGFHRTHSEDSSGVDTVNTPERRVSWEEERRTQLSRRRQFQDGIGVDDDTTEGSASYDGFDRSGHDWRGGVRRVETINREETLRRTQSGDLSRGFSSTDRYNRSEHDWREGSSTHRSESDSWTGSGRTPTGRNDGDTSYRAHIDEVGTRREGSRVDYSDHNRRITDDNRRPYDFDEENVDRYEDSKRTGGHVSSTQNWRVQTGTRRVSAASGEPARTDDEYRTVTDDSRRFEGHDLTRTRTDGYESNRDRSHHSHRVGHDDRHRIQENQDFHRTYEYGRTSSTDGSGTTRFNEYEKTKSTDDSGRTNYGGYERSGSVDSSGRTRYDSYDRTGDTNSQGTDFVGSDRSRESAGRVSSDHDRQFDRDGHRTAFDWNDRRHDSHRSESSRTTHPGEFERSSDDDSRTRTHTSGASYSSSNIDGTETRRGQGTDFVGSDRSRESAGRVSSDHDTQFDRDGHRAAFDWNERRHDSHRSESSRTTHPREFERSSDDDSLTRTHTLDASYSRSNIDGTETRRGHSSGWRSSGYEGRGSEDSRWASDTTSRTTSLDFSAGSGEQNRARWKSQSASGNRGHSYEQREGAQVFDNVVPDENGTYTRIEVDPVTGDTTVYTKRVYSRNWDRRPYSEGSESSTSDSHHTRSRRELKRVKREKELIIKPQAITDAQTGKTMQVVSLKCDGDIPTAKCFVFRCNIRNLGAKQAASIRIKSRLWNSTLVEDYPRVSYVSIKSKASLILPEDIRYDQDQSDDVASAETLAYPDLLDKLPPEEVPLWVILVSIFAGLLVLIIIVLILWKLGFFERKRPDPTLSGNLDKDANGY